MLKNGFTINHSRLDHYFSLMRDLNPLERVFISMPNSVELAHVILAAYRQGLVVVPLDPNVPKLHRDFVEIHCEPSLKLYEDDGVVCDTNTSSDLDPRLRFIMYTSGSTGNPKGVMLTQDAVEHNARTLAQIHQFQNGHATCLPLFHCNVLMMSLLGCYLTDSPLLMLPHFDPVQCFELIEKYQIRTLSLVPALVEKLVTVAPTWPDCLAYVITAAAPLSKRLAKRFYDLYGPRIRQGYGLTEATNFSFLMPQLNEDDFCREYIAQYPPVGKILPDQSLKIIDDEVHIKGPNLMLGYWKNEDETQRTITTDGYLRTGDIGVLRGDYLVLQSRRKEIINRGGVTLYPVDIEAQWREEGLFGNFAAVAVKHDRLGDEVGLWSESECLESLKHIVFNSHYRPAVVHVGPLKKTSTSKPQRNKMGQLLVSPHVPSLDEDPSRVYQAVANQVAQKCSEMEHPAICNISDLRALEKTLTSRTDTQVIYLDHVLTNEPDKLSVLNRILENNLCNTVMIAEPRPAEDNQAKLDRLEWLTLLKTAGFNEYGYTALRVGKCDFGSVFWAF